MKPIEVCSLRGHLNDITCTEPYYSAENVSLISADSKGWIIWWDINTRRPNCVWKGHDSNIVTIRQICNGLLLTHSKDSDIKIWDIEKFKDGSREMPAEKYNSVQYFNVGDAEENDNILKNELLEKFPLPEHTVIPVNALNYCNVDYSNYHLITPATTDSNNFDLYLIFKPSDQNDQSLEEKLNLKRVATSVDAWKLYKKTINHLNKEQGVESEIGNEDDILKRDRFGIMMKVMFVGDDLFYIGYESGHLIGFHIDFSGVTNNEKKEPTPHSTKPNKNVSGLSGLLGSKSKKSFDRTIINKDPEIKVVYINDSCSPNPILSLEVDKVGNRIICGSTGKQLTFHEIPHEFSHFREAKDCESYNLRHSGIQSISVNHSLLVVGFWDGIIKGYNRDINEVFKYSKRLPRIDVLESNNGQVQPHERESSMRLCTTKLVMPKETLKVSTKDYKSLIKRKRDITTANLLISSYYDGTITIFKI